MLLTPRCRLYTSQGNKAIRNADERENTTDYDLEREREGGHLSEEEMPRGYSAQT